jgi:type II secretory pathway predicted ATPase ExeA
MESENKDSVNTIPVYDVETVQRRQLIFEKINIRKKETAIGVVANKQANYDAVVSEFAMQDAEVSLLTIIKNMFKFERALKPIVKDRKQASVDSVNEAKLLVHVIRGTDVPVR